MSFPTWSALEVGIYTGKETWLKLYLKQLVQSGNLKVFLDSMAGTSKYQKYTENPKTWEVLLCWSELSMISSCPILPMSNIALLSNEASIYWPMDRYREWGVMGWSLTSCIRGGSKFWGSLSPFQINSCLDDGTISQCRVTKDCIQPPTHHAAPSVTFLHIIKICWLPPCLPVLSDWILIGAVLVKSIHFCLWNIV